MTKKKNRQRPRSTRLTSYQRALRDAEQRLDKATEERTDCLHKLAALNGEIPYLESIIQALGMKWGNSPIPLTPAAEDRAIDIHQLNSAYARAKATAPEPNVLDRKPDLLGTENLDPVDQAQFLARFMPRPGRLTTTVVPPQPPQPQPGSSPDPDEFLTADDDKGYEVLS